MSLTNEQPPVVFETLTVPSEGDVLFAEILTPPMNLLGAELVRDIVSLIQAAEADGAVQVLVFSSGDPDYFISHVHLTRVVDYRQAAAKLTGEASTTTAPRSSAVSHRPSVPRRSSADTAKLWAISTQFTI